MEIGERVVLLVSLRDEDGEDVPEGAAGMVIGHMGLDVAIVSMDLESFVGGPRYVTASERYFRRVRS